MNTPLSNTYEKRFNRVLDYIGAHLDEDLSVAKLSGIAAYSKFHFHRQFSALYGVCVSRYVQLKRLKRASHQLAYRDGSITEIAFDCTYESSEAFSRSFKKHFHQTPTDFRKQPVWDFWLTTFEPLTKLRVKNMTELYSNDDIEIISFQAVRIAAIEHRGAPENLPISIRKFITWRKANGLPPSRSATYNILHNNPNNVTPSEYRMDICAEVKGPVQENPHNIVEKIIPAGLCAKLRYVGSYDQLEHAIAYIYGEWLPQSLMEPRDFPIFLQRVTFFPDVRENEAVTDIFLPLA